MPIADAPVVETVNERVDLLKLHTLNPARYPYLLQTVTPSAGNIHFDILFACPRQTLVLRNNGQLVLQTPQGQTTALADSGDFLQTFEGQWLAGKSNHESVTDLPFGGGWFLFLGYELVQQIEPSLQLPAIRERQTPLAYATRIPAAVIVNRDSGEYSIVAERDARQSLQDIRDDIATVASKAHNNDPDAGDGDSAIIHSITEEKPERYIEAVKIIKRYIRDGDVFQVNLSRLWTAELNPAVSNAYLYQRLQQTNPAPYFALAVHDEHAIISSSPERLVKVSGNHIETRPIAGTRPRGNTPGTDEAYLEELIAHPKERAEHIMLIDLERNDLGRVCVPGSVKVNELMVLESYAHVHHIVSNVQGRLRENCSPSDVIRAVFPGGTITGCPKVRCMEIIAELEDAPRGAYTGSLGYVNHDGSMDFNILIRTLVRTGNQLSFRAGAGIVADSDPDRELQETRDKAKGLLLAL